MANHAIDKQYSEALRAIETTDPVHADTSNPLFKQLINNDAYLNEQIQNSSVTVVSGANLLTPLSSEYTKVFLTDLKKELVLVGGVWTDHSGHTAVGDNFARIAAESTAPNGFKFLDTDDQTAYIWDGSVWTALA